MTANDSGPPKARSPQGALPLTRRGRRCRIDRKPEPREPRGVHRRACPFDRLLVMGRMQPSHNQGSFPMRALLVLVFGATGALATTRASCAAAHQGFRRTPFVLRRARRAPGRPAAAGAQPKAAASQQPQPAPRPRSSAWSTSRSRRAGDRLDRKHDRGPLQGWGPNTQFRLAMARSGRSRRQPGHALDREPEGPRASRRAGRVYLEIEGSNRSPRVKRLQ